VSGQCDDLIGWLFAVLYGLFLLLYFRSFAAFSRAFRIFDRVLTKSHKYVKWAENAIESVFKESEDTGKYYADYKKNLDDSIAQERAGDAFRKKGKNEEGTFLSLLTMDTGIIL
jgi:hypothetical protein